MRIEADLKGKCKMQAEIIFISSSTPKVVEAEAIYTKAGLLCVELMPDEHGRTLILKYPLCNIFHVAHYHGEHCGSCKHSSKKS